MATVKQGTLTGVPEVADWDKHLRPILKRRVHKRERRAQAAAIQDELSMTPEEVAELQWLRGRASY